jgi:hypothetical protein
MSAPDKFLDVQFHPTPFTFEKLDGYTRLWDAPAELRKVIGVYLWTIEQPGGYMVNYAGMTASKSNYGLEGRIWAEYKDCRSGNGEPLDIDAFTSGQRVSLEEVPPDHARTQFETLQRSTPDLPGSAGQQGGLHPGRALDRRQAAGAAGAVSVSGEQAEEDRPLQTEAFTRCPHLDNGGHSWVDCLTFCVRWAFASFNLMPHVAAIPWKPSCHTPR